MLLKRRTILLWSFKELKSGYLLVTSSTKDFLIVSYLLQDKRKCTSFSTSFELQYWQILRCSGSLGVECLSVSILRLWLPALSFASARRCFWFVISSSELEVVTSVLNNVSFFAFAQYRLLCRLALSIKGSSLVPEFCCFLITRIVGKLIRFIKTCHYALRTYCRQPPWKVTFCKDLGTILVVLLIAVLCGILSV